MKRLFLDSSGDYLSVLIKEDDKTLGFSRVFCGRRMSEIINGFIDYLLCSSDLSIEIIDEFYAIVGPGSFTGVRIGVATILGLAAGSEKPHYGITSLDGAALSSCKDNPIVVSRLKGDVFALRSYDFNKNVFGAYITDIIDPQRINDYVLVNTDRNYFLDLEKVFKDDKFLEFRGECTPLYLRKSEAEINVDKKSGLC